MDKNKICYTPGPWKVRFMNPNDLDSDFFVEAKNNNMPDLGHGIEIMQDDYGDHNGYPAEQRLGDAHLISKIPEMVIAIKTLWNHRLLGAELSEENHNLIDTLIKSFPPEAKSKG